MNDDVRNIVEEIIGGEDELEGFARLASDLQRDGEREVANAICVMILRFRAVLRAVKEAK